MGEAIKPSFLAARKRYEGAKENGMTGGALSESGRDLAFRQIDEALDIFLLAPSPSPEDFLSKIHILELEYGLNAQPRHLAAIYADAGLLLALG